MGNGQFHIVSEAIIREIERKKQILDKHVAYDLLRSHKKRRALQTEALKHSVSLELEGYTTNTSEAARRKAHEKHRGEADIIQAFDWGILNYQEGEPVSPQYIEELGKRVEPIANAKGFRRNGDNVRILGATWSPPRSEKLPRELALFYSDNSLIVNPVEKAVHAHFHVARIHPFNDGNGRTARLLQNIVLQKGGYLPAAISRSERGEYLALIDRAVDSYIIANGSLDYPMDAYREKVIDAVLKREGLTDKEKGYYAGLGEVILRARMTPQQTEFFNFLALKIRDTMNREAEKISGSYD